MTFKFVLPSSVGFLLNCRTAILAVDEEQHKHQTANDSGKRPGVVGQGRQQEPLEFVVLLGPEGNSVLFSDEVVAWLLVDELELVDALFGGSHEFGGVRRGALEVGETGDHPRIQHHEFDGEVIWDVWAPWLGNGVPLFDVDLVVDFLGHGEQGFGMALSNWVEFGVSGSEEAALFEAPPQYIVGVVWVIGVRNGIELITEEIQRPSNNCSSIIQALHRSNQNNIAAHPLRVPCCVEPTVCSRFTPNQGKQLVVFKVG